MKIDPITFTYKNHRGEISVRLVTPDSIEYVAEPNLDYGYQPGWFLSGYDHHKKARRSFALTHIQLDDGIRVSKLVYRIPLADKELHNED